MLQKIVTISGKPGLYKVLSQGKNMLIVESLTDGKRMPAHATEKVVSLNDVSMYTSAEDKPLREILAVLKEKESGKMASVDPKSNDDVLRNYLAEILPDYDRERVYPKDIRKLIRWYNLLIETGFTNFSDDKEKEEKEG